MKYVSHVDLNLMTYNKILLFAIIKVRKSSGDPIDCIVEEIPNSVMDTYCWIHSTFRYIVYLVHLVHPVQSAHIGNLAHLVHLVHLVQSAHLVHLVHLVHLAHPVYLVHLVNPVHLVDLARLP